MNRSFLYGFVGLVGVAAVGLLPLACTAGAVGQPCIPEDEYSFRFPGFKLSEDVIESRSFQCATRICLVNHFQGRVSCPLGQSAPKDKNGEESCEPERDGNQNFVEGQGSCADGFSCVLAGSSSPSCDVSKGQDVANAFCEAQGAGSKCNTAGFCECASNTDCLGLTQGNVSCDSKTKQCVSYACHKPGNCQRELQPDDKKSVNAGKACCIPGTDTPVTTPVCGQCVGNNNDSPRDAESAVYCSCRCGVADGEPDDPNFNFCTCPDGFECQEIRKFVNLGDEKITGKYCIRQDTLYKSNEDQCKFVDGYWVAGGDTGIECKGAPTGKCLGGDTACDDDG